jgi:NAD(P)-dependent dehydrogenase (short-subunit alcohol dehydrogenase family)
MSNGIPSGAVVVTGGASGIGQACATALAEQARNVAIWDLDGASARAVAEQLAGAHGIAAHGIGVDVREPATFADAVTSSLTAVGPISGMVHAAGVVSIDPADRLDVDSWARVVDVNLRAFALLVPALLPALRETAAGSAHDAAIVGIASIEAIVGDGRIPAYCASKAGLLGLVRSFAVGLASEGIRVNAVCPGYVDTPMTAPIMTAPEMRSRLERRVPLGRVAAPEEIGRVVRFLLSPDASYVTGAELVVDGGLTRCVA